MKMVLYPPVDDERLERIVEAAGPMRVVNTHSEEEAAREAADAEAFFGKITPRILASARRLRWVQAATASLEHYIFPELVEHPLTLTNMRGLYGDVIADHVMGYVLCFARNLHRYLRQQLQHHWEPVGGEASRSDFASGPCRVTPMDRAHLHLSDCTLGVVGVGHIGAEVARRAACFGMRVLGVDPRRREPPQEMESLWPPDQLPQLLRQSDFVVVAAPHTPQTQGWFTREVFRQMKPTAYFINVGRGAIVRLDDLVESLRAGELAGAALDVFEVEPLPPDHPLWDMPNVLITPHVAAASPHIARRHLETLLENIRRFVNGLPLKNVVDKSQWF